MPKFVKVLHAYVNVGHIHSFEPQQNDSVVVRFVGGQERIEGADAQEFLDTLDRCIARRPKPPAQEPPATAPDVPPVVLEVPATDPTPAVPEPAPVTNAVELTATLVPIEPAAIANPFSAPVQ